MLLAVLVGALVGRPAAGNAARVSSALAQRGAAALAAGDLAAAERLLTAAYRQTPSAELLFQLGQLAALQGQRLLAHDLMRRYLNDPAANTDPQRAAAAQKVLAEPRPPSGKVRVQGDRGGLVLLDGRLLGRLPLVQPLLAAPGPRTLAIQYPGKQLEVRIDVVAGRLVDIQCTRATGAIFLANPPALLLLAELSEVAPAFAEQLLDAVDRAAQGRQLTILKPEALLSLAPELKSLPEPQAQAELLRCLAQPECLQRLLRLAQVDYALRIRATVGELAHQPAEAAERVKQWEFATELLHVSAIGVAGAERQHCAACSEQKAAAALQEAVSRTLTVGLGQPRGTLVVSSEPAGAQVWLGERLLGPTPLTLAAWAGEYPLELRQPGHPSERRVVRVAAGKTAAVAVDLPPVAPPPVAASTTSAPPRVVAPRVVSPPAGPRPWERGPRPRWRLALGATSVLVGVTFGVLGTLTMDITAHSYCGSPSAPTPSTANCDFAALGRQNNLGIASTALGGALILTGVGLLAWPGPRRQVADNP